MDKQQRKEEVKAYIEKYYVPGNDDIELDDERVQGFFGKITEFLSKRSESKGSFEAAESDEDISVDYDASAEEMSVSEDEECDIESIPEIELEEPRPAFDISTAKKTTVTHSASQMMVTGRSIEDLMLQMDETFSTRLLRMIHERNMTEAEAYKKAYVDRRHFSKIKNDEFYMPNKKTVFAFSIALELTLDETKDLLRSAGYALSRSSKFDIILVYFIENKSYDFFEINDVLYEYDQPVFG